MAPPPNVFEHSFTTLKTISMLRYYQISTVVRYSNEVRCNHLLKEFISQKRCIILPEIYSFFSDVVVYRTLCLWGFCADFMLVT